MMCGKRSRIAVLDMANLSRLQMLTDLAENMMAEATHAELTEALQILAVNLAVYKHRHGEISQDEILAVLRAGAISETMAEMLADSMAQLCGVLRTVIGPGSNEGTH